MKLWSAIARRLDPSPYEEIPKLRETVNLMADQMGLQRESFSHLAQMAIEDRGYIRLSVAHDTFFSRDFLAGLIKKARMYFFANPIIRRAVRLRAFYTFGRGVDVSVSGGSESQQEAAKESIEQFRKDNPNISIVGLSELDQTLQTDGNLFIALVSDEATGRVSIRPIDTLEIREIVTNPDDADEPWFYRREWTEISNDPRAGQTARTRSAWYPDLDFDAAGTPDLMRGAPLMRNMRVVHEKEGAPMRSLFGCPTFYAAMDPAHDYREFLQGWTTIQAAFRRFALDVETKGGSKTVAEFKNRLHTGIVSGNTDEPNPPPNTGSIFIHGPGQKISAAKTAGMTTGPDEARALFLFAIMSLDFPEHMFGDPSTGNLATAKTLDRPTELMIRHNQERWSRFLGRIYGFVLGQQAGGAVRVEGDPVTVRTSFPPIREDDVQEMIGALVDLATLKGQVLAGTIDPRTLIMRGAQILGIEDPEELADAILADGYNPADWAPQTPEERTAAAQALASQVGSGDATRAAETLTAAGLADLGYKLLEAVRKRGNGTNAGD